MAPIGLAAPAVADPGGAFVAGAGRLAGWSPAGPITTTATAPADAASISSALQAAPTTVPYWGGSFGAGGQQYPFFMVGSGPAVSATIRVPTVLIPIYLSFQQTVGAVSPNVNASKHIGDVLGSPVFQTTDFPQTNDDTQYPDAVTRAEWSGVVRNLASFHTLLDAPEVHAPVRLTVPSNLGEVVNPGDGIPRAEVDPTWWQQEIPSLVTSLHLSPTVLPIFVSSDLGSGLEAGFHGAFAGQLANGQTAIWTYAWASWFDPGWFSTFGLAPEVGADADVLSHEVNEWMNDPFLSNVVPAWSFSTPPIILNGCNDLLEVGDPLEETPFTASVRGRTFHLQDAAFFSWFAREAPSIGYQGRYSFLGTLSSFSTPCT